LHVAIVHDNFTGPTGMGLVTERHAEWALGAGWSVTVVGDNVPAWLLERARVVAALKPRRLPSLAEHLAWCARARQALRFVRADVVHVHSPLLAARADLLTSHFMEQPAHDRGVRDETSGAEGVLRRAQAVLSRRLDDLLYRRLASTTAISFVSEFLRDEFAARYGEPVGGWILSPPAPPWRPVSPRERDAARERFGVRPDAIVAGYVGGSDPRKGHAHLAGLEGRDDIQLLPAGPGSERLRFGGRPGLGFVDVDALYAACDVVVAPAVFDSAPVAVLQAVARGIPVVLSPASGWAAAVARHRAGVVWGGDESLASAVVAAARGGTAGCKDLTAEFSSDRQRDRLLDVYERIASAAAGR
jgi:glycosyltransferase involved in cell wall biosynthesis